MKKKIIVSAIIIIALGVAVFYAFFNKEKEKFTLREDKVSKGDITVQVTSTGTISAVTTVDVGTQVSGIIKMIYADFNSVVKKGQVIARIDSTNLIKTLKDAEINLAKSQVTYDAGKRNYDRVSSLYEKKLASQLEYDNALTTNEANKATLASAKASLENAKTNLDYATIYAPMDGVIINRAVNIGQTVNAGMSSPTLFSMAYDLRKMQVQATIDEADIGKIDVGQSVTFTVDAFPEDKFSGTIYQIRLSPSVSNNVVNYVVVIDVKNDDLKLMPGMTASVKVQVAQKTEVLRVPNMALRFSPPKALQDSAKVKEAFSNMRGGMRGSNAQAQQQTGQPQQAGQQPQVQPQQQQAKAGAKNMPQGQQQQAPPQTMGERARMSGNMDFAKIGAFRDSLTKAKGGNLSREEMFAAIQKRFGKQFGQGGQRPGMDNQKRGALPAQKVASAKKSSSNDMGRQIPEIFPQFQKTSSSPASTVGIGRIWIKNATTGLLEPVIVRTGITDGRYTEIYTDKLTEGQQIVIGAISNLTSTSTTTTTTSGQQSSNPFQQQGGMGGPGGGGPGGPGR
jgi:HlyD family secretion protein